MERKDFERLVSEAIDGIPAASAEKLRNVAIVVEDEPSRSTLRRNRVRDGWTLLGLYEGIPLTARGDVYGVGETLPDKITIFQKPIEEEAGGDQAEVRRIVFDTVAHEVAHYFGMDEPSVRSWEKKKKGPPLGSVD